MASIIRPSNKIRQQCRWHPYPSTLTLEHAAAQAIFQSAQSAISQRGAFHLVLAGGNTPQRVYELLTNLETNWEAWHIYFGDERCLPAENEARNSAMATNALLRHVSIPQHQIHIIPAENGAEAAASAYAQTLKKVEIFDLVLLGLGEDGHTASLFPGHAWGVEVDAPATLAILDAPKPPAQRVSLSASRLSKTRQLIFLVSGDAKALAIRSWRDGNEIPAAAIAPECGVDTYLEETLLST